MAPPPGSLPESASISTPALATAAAHTSFDVAHEVLRLNHFRQRRGCRAGPVIEQWRRLKEAWFNFEARVLGRLIGDADTVADVPHDRARRTRCDCIELCNE